MRKVALQPLGDAALVETGGTLLSALLKKDLKILMSCGGKGLCSTCHVRVGRGMDQLSPVTARERRTLALVADAAPDSRLACQCQVYGDGVEVSVPEGMYIESADDLVALLGTPAAANILHPISGAVLIPRGKLITRSLLEQSRGVAAEVRRAKDGQDTDSGVHKPFLASGTGARPAPLTTHQSAVRTVVQPPAAPKSGAVAAAGPRSGVTPPPKSEAVPVPGPRLSTTIPPPGRATVNRPTDPALNLTTNPDVLRPPAAATPVDLTSTSGPGLPAPRPGGRPTLPPLQPGTQVSKYLLIECIGKGGAGMVYRALHTKLKTPVAVKFLRPDVLAGDPDALPRFTREAQLLAQLLHPNVVRVLDYEDDPARPFVVMEYVDGVSAADLIRQSGRVAADRAVDIAAQVLDGLDAARKLGIVHRDVKPGNVLITRDGTAKLVDLGLAVVARPDGGAGGPPAAAEGTVAYMAPEQALGQPVDHRADQYSLGCTLYHLLTGRLPFVGKSTHEVMLRHLRHPADPPHVVAPGVPAELSRVVLTMMEKSAADRYPTYASLRADLAAAVAARPAAVGR